MALDAATLSQLLSTLERFVQERLIPLEAQVAAEAIRQDVIDAV